MNLSQKARKTVETAIETVIGLAVATPVLLTSTGVGTKVGAGATVLAVSVAVTNLTSVPAVERLLDRFLGNGSSAQLLSLQAELQGVESVIAEHVAEHAPTLPSGGSASSGTADAGEASAATAASAALDSAGGSTPPVAGTTP